MRVLIDTNVMISGAFWRRVSVCRDPDDNRVLECALDGHVEYIITGDKDLLDLGEFQGMRIINVSDFLQIYQRQ
jgi:predicted nucleic acid-binding protein